MIVEVCVYSVSFKVFFCGFILHIQAPVCWNTTQKYPQTLRTYRFMLSGAHKMFTHFSCLPFSCYTYSLPLCFISISFVLCCQFFVTAALIWYLKSCLLSYVAVFCSACVKKIQKYAPNAYLKLWLIRKFPKAVPSKLR